MPTFILLTRVSAERADTPHALETMERTAMKRVRAECPDVQWKASYAILGPFHYLDIFQAPDIETATKVSTLIRTFGHAHVEVWAATEWSRFKDMLHGLPGEAA